MMELFNGNLKEEIMKDNEFIVDKIRKVMKQLKRAFYKMKERRLFHWDLKLGFILIKRESNSLFDVKLGEYRDMWKLDIYSKAIVPMEHM